MLRRAIFVAAFVLFSIIPSSIATFLPNSVSAEENPIGSVPFIFPYEVNDFSNVNNPSAGIIIKDSKLNPSSENNGLVLSPPLITTECFGLDAGYFEGSFSFCEFTPKSIRYSAFAVFNLGNQTEVEMIEVKSSTTSKGCFNDSLSYPWTNVGCTDTGGIHIFTKSSGVWKYVWSSGDSTPIWDAETIYSIPIYDFIDSFAIASAEIDEIQSSPSFKSRAVIDFVLIDGVPLKNDALESITSSVKSRFEFQLNDETTKFITNPNSISCPNPNGTSFYQPQNTSHCVWRNSSQIKFKSWMKLSFPPQNNPHGNLGLLTQRSNLGGGKLIVFFSPDINASFNSGNWDLLGSTNPSSSDNFVITNLNTQTRTIGTILLVLDNSSTTDVLLNAVFKRGIGSWIGSFFDSENVRGADDLPDYFPNQETGYNGVNNVSNIVDGTDSPVRFPHRQTGNFNVSICPQDNFSGSVSDDFISTPNATSQGICQESDSGVFINSWVILEYNSSIHRHDVNLRGWLDHFSCPSQFCGVNDSAGVELFYANVDPLITNKTNWNHIGTARYASYSEGTHFNSFKIDDNLTHLLIAGANDSLTNVIPSISYVTASYSGSGIYHHPYPPEKALFFLADRDASKCDSIGFLNYTDQHGGKFCEFNDSVMSEPLLASSFMIINISNSDYDFFNNSNLALSIGAYSCLDSSTSPNGHCSPPKGVAVFISNENNGTNWTYSTSLSNDGLSITKIIPIQNRDAKRIMLAGIATSLHNKTQYITYIGYFPEDYSNKNLTLLDYYGVHNALSLLNINSVQYHQDNLSSRLLWFTEHFDSKCPLGMVNNVTISSNIIFNNTQDMGCQYLDVNGLQKSFQGWQAVKVVKPNTYHYNFSVSFNDTMGGKSSVDHSICVDSFFTTNYQGSNTIWQQRLFPNNLYIQSVGNQTYHSQASLAGSPIEALLIVRCDGVNSGENLSFDPLVSNLVVY